MHTAPRWSVRGVCEVARRQLQRTSAPRSPEFVILRCIPSSRGAGFGSLTLRAAHAQVSTFARCALRSSDELPFSLFGPLSFTTASTAPGRCGIGTGSTSADRRTSTGACCSSSSSVPTTCLDTHAYIPSSVRKPLPPSPVAQASNQATHRTLQLHWKFQFWILGFEGLEWGRHLS